MNSKEIKFLELFEEFSKIDIVNDKSSFSKSLKKFLDFDYALAVDLWEYLSNSKEEKLIKDEKFATAIGFDFFNQFYAKASIKCIKTINDNASIRRSVYQHAKEANDEKALQIIVDLIVAGKLPQADEIFKGLTKNTRIHYGQAIKKILEKVFIELLKKNPNKVVMSQKQADLFLNYIGKIKTEEKAMLEQRIKETR
ncbi:MAG: hypothetical protein FWE13_01230 [Firmicutes bacterium]|nr:hypothetical protein [Bacillota bacterium]